MPVGHGGDSGRSKKLAHSRLSSSASAVQNGISTAVLGLVIVLLTADVTNCGLCLALGYLWIALDLPLDAPDRIDKIGCGVCNIRILQEALRGRFLSFLFCGALVADVRLLTETRDKERGHKALSMHLALVVAVLLRDTSAEISPQEVCYCGLRMEAFEGHSATIPASRICHAHLGRFQAHGAALKKLPGMTA